MNFLKNNLVPLGIFLAVLICHFLLERNLDPYYYKILVDVGIAIIVAVSLNLINGITGQFSLGHAGFMAVGAYVSAALTLNLAPKLLGESGGTPGHQGAPLIA